MGLRVCLAASALGYERGGGHLWAYLNWALGLREAGCEVVWLEQAPDTPARELAAQLDALRAQLAPFALADSVVVHTPRPGAPEGTLPAGSLEDCELLLNLSYELPEPLLERFARTALVDIDPGMTQLWLAAGLLQGPRHDVYFTVGEGVAEGSARVARLGVQWHHTPPCVCLEQWPACAPVHAPYTTVTHWWADEDWVELDGRWIENSKRRAWEPLLELPAHTPFALELALGGMQDEEELERLRAHGWGVKDAWRLAGDPLSYRSYIAASRGELSVAKPLYVELHSGWFSDRSACYLACGRPVIAQWTGDSRLFDGGEGVLRFSTLEQAAAALERIESDYEHHAACALQLAEQHLDARKVSVRVLERALA
jgi:hypothetical protein